MPSQDSPASDAPSALGRRLLRVLQVVLAIEALAMVGVVVLLTVEQFVEVPFSRSSSLALLGLAVVALALVIALAVGAVRRAPGVRGAAVTWQILQLAAAWTMLQGDLATAIGWALTALSVAGIVCAVHPATRTALRRRDADA